MRSSIASLARLALLLALAIAAPRSSHAQAKWKNAQILGAQSAHDMVWDSVNERVLLVSSAFTRAQVWAWEGSGWERVSGSTGNPKARMSFALAFDFSSLFREGLAFGF